MKTLLNQVNMAMFTRPEIWIGLLGVISSFYLLIAIVWSIFFPDKRVWPPNEATAGLKVRVWLATVTIFACAFILGVMDWNALEWPLEIRWGLGLPLIILGNLIVWRGVQEIGMNATSGDVDKLKTNGLYSWSRNPQYLADILILIGWFVLSASIWASPIILLGMLALFLAPLAEEPWLENAYGDAYSAYKKNVRRYF